MTALIEADFAPNNDSSVKVSAAAGALPEASRRVIRQSIAWLRAWTSEPLILVMPAYRRSVPTAVAG